MVAIKMLNPLASRGEAENLPIGNLAQQASCKKVHE